MVPIHFQANFLPAVQKFRIEVRTPDNRWVELMTKAKFLRWARNTKAPLIIGGTEIKIVEEDAKVFDVIRGYFKQVADSYVDTYYKK